WRTWICECLPVTLPRCHTFGNDADCGQLRTTTVIPGQGRPEMDERAAGRQRAGRDLYVGQHLELVFKDFNISAAGLRLDQNAINARAFRAERSQEFRNLRAVVAGVTDLDDRANFQRFDQVPGRHVQSLLSRLYQGAALGNCYFPASQQVKPSGLEMYGDRWYHGRRNRMRKG